jgi:hypothetical protein
MISRGRYFKALLKVGGIYECREFLYPVGKEPVFLGLVRVLGESRVDIDVIASELKYYVHGVSRPYSFFRSMKAVPERDLPLYVSWAWKSEEFTRLLKGGL